MLWIWWAYKTDEISFFRTSQKWGPTHLAVPFLCCTHLLRGMAYSACVINSVAHSFRIFLGSKNLLFVDILNSASRILQCWSYCVKINSAVLCSPLWLMFVLYVFWGRRSFIDPICRNFCMVLSVFKVGFGQLFIFSARHQLDTWTLAPQKTRGMAWFCGCWGF